MIFQDVNLMNISRPLKYRYLGTYHSENAILHLFYGRMGRSICLKEISHRYLRKKNAEYLKTYFSTLPIRVAIFSACFLLFCSVKALGRQDQGRTRRTRIS